MIYLTDEDDARTAYQCVITSGGVSSSTRQIKWHAANLRCIKDDNNVDVLNEKVDKTKNDFFVKSWFNKSQGSITFEVDIKQNSRVTLYLFTLSGKKIKELISNEFAGGTHQFSWDGTCNNGRNISNGTYYYQLIVGNNQITGQCMFLR